MKKFQALINFDGAITTYDLLMTKVNGKIFDDVYFEFDSLKASQRNIRNFRMDFNPNSLKTYEIEWLKEKLIPLLSNTGFSRIDVAFDTVISLNELLYIERVPKKRNLHIGKDGVLETLYLGVRGSNVVIRIYDKLKETLDAIAKNERRIFAITNDKGYMQNDLLQEQEEKCLCENEKLKKSIAERDTWWRLEFELRREALRLDVDLFSGLSMLKPKINKENVPKVQDRAMLSYLIENPEEWDELSRPTKAKYKQMLNAISEEENNFVYLFKEVYDKKKNDLLQQVADWLNVPVKNLFDGDEMNLRHVSEVFND